MYASGLKCRSRARKKRTEVETPDILETLPSVAPSDDDHHVLYEVGSMVAARGWSLAPGDRDLLPLHPVERSADIERPDVVQCLQTVAATEYPDLVLV